MTPQTDAQKAIFKEVLWEHLREKLGRNLDAQETFIFHECVNMTSALQSPAPQPSAEVVKAFEDLIEHFRFSRPKGCHYYRMQVRYERALAALRTLPQPAAPVVDTKKIRSEAIRYGANCYGDAATGFLFADIFGGISSVAAVQVAARTFDGIAARYTLTPKGGA